MTLIQEGAQRASRVRALRTALVVVFATVFAVGGLVATPTPVDAAARKVVIVVGPVGSKTAEYIASANKLASQAASYGASVTKVYSPHATWPRVKAAAQGAHLLIYLGHGNGWPSPYGSFQRYTKDGFGLNATSGNGNSNVKYWGEYYIDTQINMAPNAVVILHRLCYASGNSEWGRANPTKSVAIQRVDNYGAGFLRANAKAVFADGLTLPSYVLYGLFKTNRTMSQIFWSASSAKKTYSFGFSSVRTAGFKAIMDPSAPGRYYRSVIGKLDLSAATWRRS